MDIAPKHLEPRNSKYYGKMKAMLIEVCKTKKDSTLIEARKRLHKLQRAGGKTVKFAGDSEERFNIHASRVVILAELTSRGYTFNRGSRFLFKNGIKIS